MAKKVTAMMVGALLASLSVTTGGASIALAGNDHLRTRPVASAATLARAGELAAPDRDLIRVFSVEDNAEAIAADEKAGPAATTAARAIVIKWPAARATLARHGAKSSDLITVDRTVATLRNEIPNRVDLRRDANEVTGALAPLFAIAGDKIPVEIHRLDYLGRSIMLDVNVDDWKRAARDADLLSSTWRAARTKVTARMNGNLAATQYDGVAKAVATAVSRRDKAATLAASKHAAALVDSLEKVFGP